MERMKIYIVYIGLLVALVFGLSGFATLLSRDSDKKEDYKKTFWDLVGVHWYMPFVSMALCIDGIYASLGLFFESLPPSKEDFIFDILYCIFSVLSFIGLVYSFCLIREYMKNLTKDQQKKEKMLNSFIC